MKGAGHVARMGENPHVYKVSVGRREGKGPLGKPKGRWKYNTKLDTKEQDRRMQTGFIRLAVVGTIWKVLTFVTQYTSCRTMYVHKNNF